MNSYSNGYLFSTQDHIELTPHFQGMQTHKQTAIFHTSRLTLGLFSPIAWPSPFFARYLEVLESELIIQSDAADDLIARG